MDLNRHASVLSHSATHPQGQAGLKPTGSEAPRHLLVVQQSRMLARSLARLLGRHFDDVGTASSLAEAETALADLAGVPAVVLCGQNLGEQRTSDHIERWRRTYPAVRRVVMLTGSEDLPTELDGIDAFIFKPVDPGVLRGLFEYREEATRAAWGD